MSGADEDRDLHAAEYVLGTFGPAEARAVEAEAARDPAMRAAIAGWEGWLAPLAAYIEPVAPPSGLWARFGPAATERPDSQPRPA